MDSERLTRRISTWRPFDLFLGIAELNVVSFGPGICQDCGRPGRRRQGGKTRRVGGGLPVNTWAGLRGIREGEDRLVWW